MTKPQNYLLTTFMALAVLGVTGCSTSPLTKQTSQSKPQPQQTQPVVDEHSAEYALDYEGTYTGILPCADCQGIKTKLILNKDKTFLYEQNYLGKSKKPFINSGNYQVKGGTLTLSLADKPLNFSVGESGVYYLDDKLQRYTGKLASYYTLAKQKDFDFVGSYSTAKKGDVKGSYQQTISIKPTETTRYDDSYQVSFSASKVRGRAGCSFSGKAVKKDGSLWLNVSNDKSKQVKMYLRPLQDKQGVDVFTEKFDERFAMMYYCRGGASLAGEYMKVD